jgi:hypothetical protein
VPSIVVLNVVVPSIVVPSVVVPSVVVPSSVVMLNVVLPSVVVPSVVVPNVVVPSGVMLNVEVPSEKRKKIQKQFYQSVLCPSFFTLSQMHSLKMHQKQSLSLSVYNTGHWLTQRLDECGGESNLA